MAIVMVKGVLAATLPMFGGLTNLAAGCMGNELSASHAVKLPYRTHHSRLGSNHAHGSGVARARLDLLPVRDGKVCATKYGKHKLRLGATTWDVLVVAQKLMKLFVEVSDATWPAVGVSCPSLAKPVAITD